MIAKLCLTLSALAVQYSLLHSHKAGQSHWIWIASASVVLLVVAMRSRCAVTDRNLANRLLAVFAFLSLLLPAAIYVVREWLHVPASVASALAHDTWFYLMSVTLASGGWLFTILLIWVYRSAAGQPPPSCS